ncbi:hypothetical protein EYF80_062710 [Liparis tanakae]|uniref:Uncharacterized protein n=1 Tax=Liparis tanakae TaxID=230148 RepID=A0A4Z2EEE9_9TELE|nr:hypothetical protein EYF80_062710 [Liparis tanakae]
MKSPLSGKVGSVFRGDDGAKTDCFLRCSAASPFPRGDGGVLGEAVAALGRPGRRQRRFSRDALARRPNPQRCSLIKTTPPLLLTSTHAAAPHSRSILTAICK